MNKPIKMSFTVELTVLPDDEVTGVLSKMKALRSAVCQLGFGRVGALTMPTPERAPDGLIAMLTGE